MKKENNVSKKTLDELNLLGNFKYTVDLDNVLHVKFGSYINPPNQRKIMKRFPKIKFQFTEVMRAYGKIDRET